MTGQIQPDIRADIREEDRWRASTYAMLARLLTVPPDVKTLQTLATIETTTQTDTDLARAWVELVEKAREARVQAVDDEYHKLFIGVGRGELIPYSSFYLSGFIMNAPLAELRDTLRQLNLERKNDVYESEDHIAAACDVMYLLITSDPLESGWSDDVQKMFFEKHLAPWAGRFFDDLHAASEASFYKSVGYLGVAFMELEAECIRL